MSQQNARYRVHTFNSQTFAMKTEFLDAAHDDGAVFLAMERFADHRWEIFEASAWWR